MKRIILVYLAIVATSLWTGCGDNTPLTYETIHEAAAKGDLADVRRHLRRGSAVNDNISSGETPLFAASREGQTEVVRFLIENGAEINYTSNYTLSPLYVAILGGHTEIVGILIQNGADVNAAGMGLEKAARDGNMKIVELLIDNGLNLTEYGAGAIYAAVVNGQSEIADLITVKGDNVNAWNENTRSSIFGTIHMDGELPSNGTVLAQLLDESGSAVLDENSRGLNLPVRVGTSGNFTMTDIRPGRYKIQIQHLNYQGVTLLKTYDVELKPARTEVINLIINLDVP